MTEAPTEAPAIKTLYGPRIEQIPTLRLWGVRFLRYFIIGPGNIAKRFQGPQDGIFSPQMTKDIKVTVVCFYPEIGASRVIPLVEYLFNRVVDFPQREAQWPLVCLIARIA